MIVFKKNSRFILTKFLRSFLKTINQRYCAIFPFQRQKARVEILNTRLRIWVNTPVLNKCNFCQVTNLFQSLSNSSNFYQILSISIKFFQFLPISFNFYHILSISINLYQFLLIFSNLYQILSIPINLYQFLSISINFY